MCQLCAEADGYDSCQDCGRLICFDAEPSDVDVLDQAYVTSSGDLYCRRCGSAHDRAEEELAEDDYEHEWHARDCEEELEDGR